MLQYLRITKMSSVDCTVISIKKDKVVAVGIFLTRHNTYPMKVLVKNPISAYYLGEPEVMLSMELF